MKDLINFMSMIFLLFPVLMGAEGDFSSKIISMGVVVSDLDKSLAFYTEVVGMVHMKQESFDVTAETGRKTGLTDNLAFRVEVLKLGSGAEATQFKLMSFGDKAKKWDNRYISDHTGVQYLTIFVTELEPVITRIKAHKVKMLGETPTLLNEDTYLILIKDPDGTFVELIGPMKKE
jgi:catechol 2,3-dioxygenase-like lactoylglutathione lyase family enzyme